MSISFASSLDKDPVFMIRNGDTVADAKELIETFLNVIKNKAEEFKATVPQKFQESLDRISKIEKERWDLWKQRRDEGIPGDQNKLELFPVSWKQWLTNMVTYRIFGFNRIGLIKNI